MRQPAYPISMVLTLVLLLPGAVLAERSVTAGDFVVHYNAFNATFLEPAIAQQHGVTRSRYRGVVTVAVLKAAAGTTGQPATAEVRGEARNLAGQTHRLDFRQVREETAIYYLAEMRIADGETLRFNLKVTPEPEGQAIPVAFEQEFFTD